MNTARNNYSPPLEYIRNHCLLFSFIVLLAIFRLNLATSGHQFIPDENIYYFSILFLKNIAHGNILTAISCLFYMARPGYVLIGTILAVFQSILYIMGIITPSNPHFSDFPSIFNVAISLLITVIYYHILLIPLKSRSQSLLGTVIYSLLCNTNIYIRHLLPYDLSLLMFLIALFLVLRSITTSGLKSLTAVNCGVVSSLGYLIYPGYHLFVIIITVLIFAGTRNGLRMSLWYLSAAAAPLIFTEIIAGISGESYILSLISLSTVQNQGSSEEQYIFLVRYLTNIEGLIGYIILFMFSIYCIFILRRSSTQMKALFLMVVICYLFHGTLAVIYHKVYFYGRRIHMYYPFLVLGTMLTMNSIQKPILRKLIMLLIASLSLISFIGFASQYSRLSYPKDFKYKYLSNYRPEEIYTVNELMETKTSDFERYSVVAVNVMYLYPIPEKLFPVIPPPNMLLIKAVPHPLNFNAYAFEGFSIVERKRLQDRKYQMRIYVKSRE